MTTTKDKIQPEQDSIEIPTGQSGQRPDQPVAKLAAGDEANSEQLAKQIAMAGKQQWAPTLPGLAEFIDDHARDDRDRMLAQHLRTLITDHDMDADPCSYQERDLLWPCETWMSALRLATGWLMDRIEGTGK